MFDAWIYFFTSEDKLKNARVTTDGMEMVRWLDELFVDGGDDCPEYVNGGTILGTNCLAFLCDHGLSVVLVNSSVRRQLFTNHIFFLKTFSFQKFKTITSGFQISQASENI